jgi:hypothetical protein
MICWRCTHLVAEGQAVCPHCSSGSSQKASAGSDEVGFQVHERGAEVQSSTRWESSAPSTYQVTAALPKDTGLVWGGFISIFFGAASLFGGAGGIMFGVIAILCGISTLVVSHFGAKPRPTLSPGEKMLVYPGWIIAWVFLGFAKVFFWFLKLFTGGRW